MGEDRTSERVERRTRRAGGARLGIAAERRPEERRAPLAPGHVDELVGEWKRPVAIEPSAARPWSDDDYRVAGARRVDRTDLASCGLVLSLALEAPDDLVGAPVQAGFVRAFQSAPLRVPLLREARRRGTSLIDLPAVADRFGQRLVSSGSAAGHAAALDALWVLGRRFAERGISTPLAELEPSHVLGDRGSLEDSLATVERAGRRLRGASLPESLHPVVIGVTGGGKVSRGVQEVLARLPRVEIPAEELADLASWDDLSRRVIYQVVFRRHERVHFARHLPHLTALVNAIRWEPSYPRLVLADDLRALDRGDGTARLEVLVDVAADPGGSIEVTSTPTTPDAPARILDLASLETRPGVVGDGPTLMAPVRLASRFARRASEQLGDGLLPLLGPLLDQDWSVPFDRLDLPAAVLGAVLVHRGELTPRYRYLEDLLRRP